MCYFLNHDFKSSLVMRHNELPESLHEACFEQPPLAIRQSFAVYKHAESSCIVKPSGHVHETS
jgi:hypothetical protein